MQDSHVFQCNAKSQEANREVARLSASLYGGRMMDKCGFVVLVTYSKRLVTRNGVTHQGSGLCC